MAYDNTAEPAIRAARVALANAMLTFGTSTVPPLAATLSGLVRVADPSLPMCAPAEQTLYTALCNYVNNYLIPNGLFAGPPLPLR